LVFRAFLVFEFAARSLFFVMALVRILVDGYSLLHSWPELAEGKPRHSAAARDELIQMLSRYRDASGTPMTVVFDGGGPKSPKADPGSSADVEILYSRAGQTADQIIERVTHRIQPYGEVLVVTDDYAERDTVIAMGGMAASCASFIQMIAATLGDLERDVANYNSREKRRYKRS
jgi:predicted RNA-binding protein with PIN domain